MQSIDITPSDRIPKGVPYMKILDAKVLTFNNHEKNVFAEISGLAYDKRDDILYAVSDHGTLFHLKLTLSGKTIKDIRLIDSYILRNKKDKRYKKSKRDAEGLSLYKDGLLVSFERHPRIILFDKKGKRIKKMKIDTALKKIDDYQSENDALEAVTYHSDHGIITAPEHPLRGHDKKNHILYAKTSRWKFRASGAITALEMMPDGNILVLERHFDKKTKHRVITLRTVNINKCKKKKRCPSTLLAQLDSYKGWTLDNFEGLTHLFDNLYLMISDDNDSKQQRTIAVLFEILPYSD